jgi:hypothetical protein
MRNKDILIKCGKTIFVLTDYDEAPINLKLLGETNLR